MNQRSVAASVMAEREPWRFGRGWSEGELKAFLDTLKDRPVNFDEPPERMTAANGWTIDGDRASIGHEPEGPPVVAGPFARAGRRSSIMTSQTRGSWLAISTRRCRSKGGTCYWS